MKVTLPILSDAFKGMCCNFKKPIARVEGAPSSLLR